MKITSIILSLILISCSSFKSQEDIKYDSALNKAKSYLKRYDSKQIEQKAEYHYINGLTEQQKGNWAESLIDFNLALNSDSSASILYSMAKSYSKINRFELALESLIKSIDIKEDFVPSLELLSEIYVALNDIQNAVAIQKKVVRIDDSFRNRLRVAQLYEYYDKESSIAIYQGLYEETQDSFILDKLLKLYDPLIDGEKYQKILEDLYYANPESTKYAFELLDFYLDHKDYKETVDLLEKADTYLSNQDKSRFYGSVGYELLNDTTNIDTVLVQRFISKIDDEFYLDWRINMITGYLETKIGNWESSYPWFERTLKISDENSDIPLQMGIHYLNYAYYNLADSILNKALEIYPNEIDIYFYKGISNSFDNHKQALVDFDNILRLDSNNIEALVQIGVIYDNIKNLDSLSYYYERALEIDSRNALANNNYAYSLAVRGIELDKAERLSAKALELQPNNPAYLDTYAWIQYKLENFNIALEYMQKALKLSFPTAELYEHLGDIHSKLGNNEDAKQAYRMALELEPERENVATKLNGITE